MTPDELNHALSFFREGLQNLRETSIKLFDKADEQARATTELSGDVRILAGKIDGAFSPERTPCNTVREHIKEHKQNVKTRAARSWGIASRIIIASILALGGFVAGHLHF